jgi:hypothetical protein
MIAHRQLRVARGPRGFAGSGGRWI